MAAIGWRVRCAAIAILLLGSTGPSRPADEPPLRVVNKVEVQAPSENARPGHRLHLTLAMMRETGWEAEPVLEAAKRAAQILAQCDIRAPSISLIEFDGPNRYRTLYAPVSRNLARELALPKPTVFFLAGTRQHPAFDAEAVGRGNSRTRPEMADTVWIVRGARDLDVVIAHELAHVLADSGEHSIEAGNLMREDTAPGATHLTPAQCEAIVKTGTAKGLLASPAAPVR